MRRELIDMKKWAYAMLDAHPDNAQYYAGVLVGLLNVEKWEIRDAHGDERPINDEIHRLSQTRNSLPKVPEFVGTYGMAFDRPGHYSED